MGLKEIIEYLPKINCTQKFVCYRTHIKHLSEIAWMYPEEFLMIQGEIYNDEIKRGSYLYQATELVYFGRSLDVPQICWNNTSPTHDGRHRVLSFYKNCKNHKIPVWICSKKYIKDNFDYIIPKDVEILQKENGYIYLKIPTGL